MSGFTLVEPARPTPLVVSVPHAGLEVPEEDREIVALDERALRLDADLAVDRLCANAPALGAALLVAQVSRYVVDLNRAPEDRGGTNPRGVIWRAASDGATVSRRALSEADVERRLAYHAAYHAQLRSLLKARVARFGFAILLDAHSMPSEYRGARLPDVIPGDRGRRACDALVTALVHERCAARGFSAVSNHLYRGGYITRAHGRPRAGVHALQLELNRDLYMDERARELEPARASRVTALVDDIVDGLVQLALARQTRWSEPLRPRRARSR